MAKTERVTTDYPVWTKSSVYKWFCVIKVVGKNITFSSATYSGLSL